MNRHAHVWIAVRAVRLLEEEGKNANLVKLLKPALNHASLGAWAPDVADAKRGGNATENHVLKMKPAVGERFIAEKSDLCKRLGEGRQMGVCLKNDQTLDEQWWKQPYRGDPMRPGQHIPNRAMALATTIADMLIFGNKKVSDLVPGEISFKKDLDSESCTQAGQASLYFFMSSHFIADCCMPCHCDGRDLADYANGLHDKLEEHWSKQILKSFDPDMLDAPRLKPDACLKKAAAVDDVFALKFPDTIPPLKSDVWEEMINVCRASFALCGIIASPQKYLYGQPKVKAPFKEVFSGEDDPKLAEMDRVVLHDAVLNTAMVWKHIWKKVSKD